MTVNRRYLLQSLGALGAGTLLSPKPFNAQPQTLAACAKGVCGNAPPVDLKLLGEHQKALAKIIKTLGNPHSPQGKLNKLDLDDAVAWSHVYADYAKSSGITAYLDGMLNPSDPMNITGAVAPASSVLKMQDNLHGLGLNLSYDEVAGYCSGAKFRDVAKHLPDVGGTAGILTGFASKLLPTFYSPSSMPMDALSMARLSAARAARTGPGPGAPRTGGRLHTMDDGEIIDMYTEEDTWESYDEWVTMDGVNCKGVNQVTAIFQVTIISLTIATTLGCAFCPIIAISQLLPLLVVTVVKGVYCSGA